MEFSIESFGDEFEKISMQPHHKRVLKHLGGWAVPGAVMGAIIPVGPDDKKTKDGVGRRVKNAIRGGAFTSAYGGGLTSIMDSMYGGKGQKIKDISRTAGDMSSGAKNLVNKAVAKFKAPEQLKKLEGLDNAPATTEAKNLTDNAISKALSNMKKPKKKKRK